MTSDYLKYRGKWCGGHLWFTIIYQILQFGHLCYVSLFQLI